MNRSLFALTVLGIVAIAPAALADDGTPTAPPPNGSGTSASASTEGAAAPDGEGPKESGLEFGARLGYGIPMGDAAKDSKLSDAYSGMVPIWLDVGYRIIPQIYVGAYGQFAPAFAADKSCPNGASCGGNDIRFGANVHYHIIPQGPFDPWVGLGFGYEFANLSAEANGVKGSTQVKGFEFANIQAGGDYKVTPNIRVGPFVSFSLGQYDSSSTDVAGKSTSGDIKDKTMHQWLTLGIRGAYDL